MNMFPNFSGIFLGVFIAISFVQVIVAFNYSLHVDGEAYGGYYVTFEIGSPPQRVSLLIDTGSSTLAVATTAKEVYDYFKWNESSTFRKTSDTLNIKYIVGSWSGFIGYDNVQLCSEPKHWCLFESQFSCITDSEKMFTDNATWMGILGLAYPAITKPYNFVVPFFDGLIKNHLLSSKVFALSLCGPLLYGLLDPNKSKMHLGYIDDNFYDGDIVYTPITKERFYEIMLTGLKIDSVDFDMPCVTLNTDKTIVDSGTTSLEFPSVVHDWIIRKFKNVLSNISEDFPNEFWMGKAPVCSDRKVIDAFPNITLVFSHSENSTFSMTVSPDLYLLGYKLSSTPKLCYKFGLSPSKTGTIIGGTILKGFYVIFDQGNKRLGFANSTCSDGAAFVTKPVYEDPSSLQCVYIYNEPIAQRIIGYVSFVIVLVLAIIILYKMSIWFYHFIWLGKKPPDTHNLVSETL